MKRKMIIVLGVICLWLTLAMASCTLSSEDRVSELGTWVGTVQELSNQATVEIGMLEESIAVIKLQLENTALNESDKAELIVVLTALQGKLISAETMKIKADEAMIEWKAQIDRIVNGETEIGVGDELLLYGEGLSALGVAVPAPYGVWVTLGGSLLTILGGLFGSRAQKVVDRKVITNEKMAFSTVVNSVSAALDAIDSIPADSSRSAADVAKTAMESIQKSITSVDVESKVKEAKASPL
jgi:hypothetical protein